MITSPISPPEGPLVVFETPIATPCLIAPRNTWCGKACFWERVSAKYGTWMIGSFCNLCTLALGVLRWRLHIFGKQSWWVPKRTKQLSTRTTSPAAILLYQFLSCWCQEETFFTWHERCSLLFGFAENWDGRRKKTKVELAAGSPLCCWGTISERASLLRSRSGRSHATLLVPTRGDGERCVTPAQAAAKETRDELEIVWRLRLRHRINWPRIVPKAPPSKYTKNGGFWIANPCGRLQRHRLGKRRSFERKQTSCKNCCRPALQGF